MKKHKVQFILPAYVWVLIALSMLFIAGPSAAYQSSAKHITIAYLSEPDALVPTDSSYAVTSSPINNNIFDRLVDLTPDGQFVGGIASWEILSDGKEFLFTVSEGIKFHSGDNLTAEDIAFSHDRAMVKSATYKRYMRNFDHMEVINSHQIKFVFKKPDVLFIPTRILHVVSKSYFDRVGEEKFLSEPVGTGPYRFVSWKRGEYIEIARNDTYWGLKPQVEQARFVFVKEDTTRIAMLKAGEADIIMSAPYPLVKDIENSGYKTVRLYAHPPCSVQFHTGNPDVPWHDRKVRLAIAYAIDKDAIVNDLFQGIPSGYPRLAPWELGYDPEIKQYPYDVKKAKKLLKEAGYPKGFQMPLYYFAGRSYGQKETAEVVSLYLNAVGIKCKVEGIEGAQLMAKIRSWHTDRNSVYAGVTPTPLAFLPDPLEALTTAYHSTGFGSMYFNPDLDPIIDEARVTMDEKKRGELIKQAVKIIHADVATVQIWANTSVYAMQPNINFTPTVKNREPLMLLKDVRVK